MARGQQKIQSQQKNAEKKAKQKKGSSQLKAADKALIYSCTVCLVCNLMLIALNFNIVSSIIVIEYLVP